MARATRWWQDSRLFLSHARYDVSKPISHAALRGDLDAFQRQVHADIELDNDSGRKRWCELTGETFKQLKASAANRRREIHALVFRDVAQRDPGKYVDIHRLKQADTMIREYLDVVQAHLAAFAATQDEEQEDIRLQLDELRLVSDQLVESLREQEQAVMETFAESIDV